MRDPRNPAWLHDNGPAVNLVEKSGPAARFYWFYWVRSVCGGNILLLHFLVLNMNILFQDVKREWDLGAEISEIRKHPTLSFQFFVITWLSGSSLGESSLPSANCIQKLFTLIHILDPGTC